MAVDPNIKKKADDIRNKIYGKEVRESLASGLEAMSTDVVDTVSRQGNVESQFQDVIESTTDKDVISAPEIIAARNGEANLKTRLDEEHQEVTSQLAQEVNQRTNDVRDLRENKANKNEVRKVTDKIKPEDMSGETLALITGEGEINLETIPQDHSVTMPKFEPNLRQDFEDLFNAFGQQDDFIPIELFDGSQVKQGGVLSSGITNSTTRTHIEIEVQPGKEYYVTIPESDYLRLRSISSWNGDRLITWNLEDNSLSGFRFVVPSGANTVIVSFCKENTSENLSPFETASEFVSIFELVYKAKNLITNIYQGGIDGEGVFTDSPTRTRTDIIPINKSGLYRIIFDDDSPLRIRSVALYRSGELHEFRYFDLQYVTKRLEITNGNVADGLVVSFANANINDDLTPQETKNANAKVQEAYR